MYLEAVLSAWGSIPPKSASVPTLETLVKMVLIKISEGNNMDPEIPDTWEALVLPALLSRGIGKKDAVDAINKQSLSASSGGGSNTMGQQTQTMDMAAASQDTVTESLSEGWNNLISGNVSGWWDNTISGWNALTQWKW